MGDIGKELDFHLRYFLLDINIILHFEHEESQAQAEEAVKVAKGVEGVTSVSDKLHVRDSKDTSVKGYAGDTAITSEVKAKLLADDIVPSRKVKVETTDGVVQLSGTVESQAQSDRAESIAKAIDGVKSVKNDLKAK